MRTVHLHGHLAKEFGDSFSLDVATAGEAVRALNAAFPGRFLNSIREGSYQIIRGRRHGGMSLDVDMLNTLKLGRADLHFVPVAHGSGNKGGTVKAVVGVAIVGAAIFASGGTLAAPLAAMGDTAFTVLGAGVSYGSIALFGVGLALAGAASMLANSDAKPSDATDEAQSFNFGGPVNVNEQGNAVPLIYGGPIIVGSQPISAEFDIEDIGTYSDEVTIGVTPTSDGEKR